jgi:hypothetical protein
LLLSKEQNEMNSLVGYAKEISWNAFVTFPEHDFDGIIAGSNLKSMKFKTNCRSF